MKWLIAMIVALTCAGCGGLQRDYVPPDNSHGGSANIEGG
jgi:hypothetical protein